MIRRKWRQFITRLAECSEWLMPRHQRLNVFGPALLSQVLSYRLLNLSCRIMIQCGTSLSLSSCLPKSMLRRRARRDILSSHGRFASRLKQFDANVRAYCRKSENHAPLPGKLRTRPCAGFFVPANRSCDVCFAPNTVEQLGVESIDFIFNFLIRRLCSG